MAGFFGPIESYGRVVIGHRGIHACYVFEALCISFQELKGCGVGFKGINYYRYYQPSLRRGL